MLKETHWFERKTAPQGGKSKELEPLFSAV
jgi:hypothetical protein